jgi:hypothetical protein
MKVLFSFFLLRASLVENLGTGPGNRFHKAAWSSQAFIGAFQGKETQQWWLPNPKTTAIL